MNGILLHGSAGNNDRITTEGFRKSNRAVAGARFCDFLDTFPLRMDKSSATAGSLMKTNWFPGSVLKTSEKLCSSLATSISDREDVLKTLYEPR